MSPAGPVLAAGAVCWRVENGEALILAVHRSRHDDVSLPKGKVDPGETLPETAVREIAEETGLIVALGVPLGVIEYVLPNGRDKTVSYWAAEVDDLTLANSNFSPNDEVDSLRWLSIPEAREQLSYPHDVDIVDRFAELFRQGRARTFAIIALRHGKAMDPGDWDGPDATRPLRQRGLDQAASVAPGVAAYRPAKLISSTAVRCLSTIAPVARITGLDVADKHGISQDAFEAEKDRVDRIVERRITRGRTTVLCTHGPVLPRIVAASARLTNTPLDRRMWRASSLGTGEYAVMHIPCSDPGTGIVAIEIHSPSA